MEQQGNGSGEGAVLSERGGPRWERVTVAGLSRWGCFSGAGAVMMDNRHLPGPLLINGRRSQVRLSASLKSLIERGRWNGGIPGTPGLRPRPHCRVAQ